VLRRIKQRDDLRSLPVVVFTTSSHPGDVEACYRLGANSYHRKPSDFYEYILTIQAVTDYWLKRVIAPQQFSSLGLPIETPLTGKLQTLGADT
jgi:CheY-like chemotaxis protein